jgi:hypothetical protein
MRTPSRLSHPLRIAALGVIGLALTSCTSDVTRQRVEADMRLDFANQLKLTASILGQPIPSTVDDSVTCDKGGPKVADKGPGKDWVCMVTYATDGGPATTTRYELFVHGEACYTATDPALIEQPSIIKASTGKSVANPLEQFDGCFNVYDNKISITQ